MKSFKHFLFAVATIFLVAGCQKEYSLETGTSGAPARGTLRDAAGNCQPFSAGGTYYTDSTLKDSNYVLVQVNITTPGSYRISTDIQNGFSFADSGIISTTGLQTFKLKGTGRPILPVTTDFTIAFDTTFCLFSIPVQAGSSTGTGATYTLATGTGGSCTGAAPQGTYTTGTSLSGANSVLLNVNVTTIGSWSIITNQVNGMRFAGAGNFTAVGPQTVRLVATGRPVTAGATTIPVTAGGTTCSFTVNVQQGTGTSGPTAADSAWSFVQGASTFHGRVDTAFIERDTATMRNLLFIVGSTYATGDSVLVLAMAVPGTTPQVGTFNSRATAGFFFEDFRNPNSSVTIFKADPSVQTVTTTITVTNYNSTTRIVTGTFTGTAIRASNNTPVTISSGKFTARVGP